MIDPTNTLGTREKRLAAMVPRLSEALKRASKALEAAATLGYALGQHREADDVLQAVAEFDRLTLEADRI